MQLLWQDETKFATLFTKKEQNQSGSVPKAAVDRNRTGTGITTHGILSPGRLPVPPLRHNYEMREMLIFQCFSHFSLLNILITLDYTFIFPCSLFVAI